MATIDLNADVGEGAGSDAELIPLVTSVNVCGGAYAGDRDTIRAAIELAVAHGAAIGAHPGYPDREGFGRRLISIEPAALRESVAQQLGLVAELAAVAGGRVAYVKPHGALYHQIGVDRAAAQAVEQAIVEVDLRLPVLLAPGALQAQLAAARGVRAYREGFADRAYTPQLELLARGEPGATLASPAAAAQAIRLALHHEVVDAEGRVHPLTVDSICLHGDTPGAAAAAGGLRSALIAAQLTLKAFTDSAAASP